jgi:hypothetical protein
MPTGATEEQRDYFQEQLNSELHPLTNEDAFKHNIAHHFGLIARVMAEVSEINEGVAPTFQLGIHAVPWQLGVSSIIGPDGEHSWTWAGDNRDDAEDPHTWVALGKSYRPIFERLECELCELTFAVDFADTPYPQMISLDWFDGCTAAIKRLRQDGNNFYALKASALPLFAAARVLRPTRDSARTALENVKEGDSMPDEGMLHAPEMMLRGFAVECLLKGLWVRQGNKLAENGKYVRVPNIKNEHDLVGLAVEVGFTMTAEQRDLLEHLSVYTITVGRYPIPVRTTNSRLVWWTTPKDNETLDGIVADLLCRLN